LRDCCI